jgi:hypothetical protein
MLRTRSLLLAGLAVLTAASASSAAELAGNWKLSFFEEAHPITFGLVKFEAKGGKLAATLLAVNSKRVPEGGAIEDTSVAGDRLRFTFRVKNQDILFEGTLPRDGSKQMVGSLAIGRQVVPARLEPTRLTSLDPVEVARDILSEPNPGPGVFDRALEQLAEAPEKKGKPDDVRELAERLHKLAEPYGPRWQREVALRIARGLVDEDGYEAVAVEFARRAERLLDAKERPAVQFRILNTLESALKRAGRADEAKQVGARLDKIPLEVETTPFAGRKGKSDRAVLVELFTGAQCPPCVAADLAFDGLGKTYKPAEVVLLQYHVNVPRPDALANPDTEARMEYYGEQVKGTPHVLFDGNPGAPGGGGLDEGEEKYREYRDVIDPLLDKPSLAELQVSAVRKGDEVQVRAKVSGLEKPGDKVRVRFALVEQTIRYAGTNGMRVHHHVVRALPGGPEGKALTARASEVSASVNVQDLRKRWGKYLDDVAKEGEFPSTDRPMDFKNLRIVAFVQNDATQEILQAVQAEVRDAGSE